MFATESQHGSRLFNLISNVQSFLSTCEICGDDTSNTKMHNRLCARMVAKGITYLTANPNESMDVDVHRDPSTRQFLCVGSSNTGPCRYASMDTDGIRVSDKLCAFLYVADSFLAPCSQVHLRCKYSTPSRVFFFFWHIL